MKREITFLHSQVKGGVLMLIPYSESIAKTKYQGMDSAVSLIGKTKSNMHYLLVVCLFSQ